MDSASESEPGSYDDFGFLVSDDDEIQDSSQKYAQWFEPKARRRLQRFEALQKQLPTDGQWTVLPASKLKALCRKGLPAQHRGEVWWSLLGCEARRARAPQAYHEYLSQPLEQRTSDEINRDLGRTFPNHKKFRTEEGRSELQHVLHAYARHSPRVMYCQGLNYIAALLLVVFLDEERSFWALACALETLGVEDYYTEGMMLLRTDMRVLELLLGEACPKVARCLREQGVELLSICSEWYITWFAKSMPLQPTLRVWDTLFCEGYKVLFRVALGVFKRVESQVLSHPTFEDIMENAKQWPRRQVEHNALLKASFGSGIVRKPLRRRYIQQARDDALCSIQLQDEESRRKVQARREDAAQKAALRPLNDDKPPAAPSPLAGQGGGDAAAIDDSNGRLLPSAPKSFPLDQGVSKSPPTRQLPHEDEQGLM